MSLNKNLSPKPTYGKKSLTPCQVLQGHSANCENSCIFIDVTLSACRTHRCIEQAGIKQQIILLGILENLDIAKLESKTTLLEKLLECDNQLHYKNI